MGDGPKCFGEYRAVPRCWRCTWCRECWLWVRVNADRERTEEEVSEWISVGDQLPEAPNE